MAGKLSYEELEQKVKELEKKAFEHEKVKDALNLFSHSFEYSIHGLAMGNTENRITYVNETFAKMFDYSREELMGKEIALIYADDQIPILEEALKITMEGGWTGELIGKKKDGTQFPVSVSSSRVLDDKGNVITHIASHRDITQQKQTLETLRESEEKWRSLAETAPCIILTVQRDGTIQFLNRSVGNYTPEDTIGTKVWDYVPPDHHSVMQKAIEHVFQTGLPIVYEILGAGVEGPASTWYMTQLGPILKDGEVAAVTMVSTDITEMKKVYKALEESEAQKKAILDSSIDRIRLVDTDMRIIWANKTTTRELHITPEDLVGKFCYQVFVGRDTPCSECPTKKALTSGTIEHAILHKLNSKSIEGESHWDNYAVPLKGESGDIVNCIQITRNITEKVQAEKALRESEEKWRRLFEDSRDAISITTRNGEYVDANQSFLDLFGYTREEAINSNAIDRYINPIDRIKFTKEVIQKGSVKDYEVKLKKTNGEEMITLCSATLRRANDGSILGYQSIVRDITQQKRDVQAIKEREAELEVLNKQLEENNRALSVLARNLDITRRESEKRIVQRTQNFVMPIIEKLRQDKNLERYKTDFDLLIGYVRDLTSDLANDIKIPLSLSATELRVASLIRNGMSSQEIAKHLYVTASTVMSHRKNIRRKLDLHNSGINLKAYLESKLDQR